MIALEMRNLGGGEILHACPQESLDKPLPCIVFYHGFTSSKLVYSYFAVALAEAGEDLGELVWSFRPIDPRAGTEATQSPESLALSKALKQRGFVFVGPVTMFALMQAIGILEHRLG